MSKHQPLRILLVPIRFQEVLEFQYPYEKLAQTFNPQMGVTDVWRDIDFYSDIGDLWIYFKDNEDAYMLFKLRWA